jgi:hypothetical protein
VDLSSGRRATLVVAAVSGTIAAIAVAVLAAPAIRLDFFFDEMWRVEQVRSDNPLRAYLDGPAPIPPGWVVSLWSVFEVLPPRRPLLRIAAAAFAIPAAVALALALRTMLRRVLDELGASIVAIGSATLVVTTTAIAVHAVYFNNYLADLAVAATLLLLLARIDLDRADDTATWSALVVLAAVAPWLAQSALFLVPVAAFIVFGHRHLRPRHALAGAGARVVSTAVVGFGFVLPVARNGTIEDYWITETPRAGVAEVIRRFGSSFVDGAYPGWVDGHPVLTVVALAATAAGLAILQRCWRWWLPLALGAQAVALVASVAVTWPTTFVRVNTGFQMMFYVAAPVAAITATVVLLQRLAARTHLAAAVLVGAALAAGVALAWWPYEVRRNSASTGVYARGLSDDLQLVAEQATPGDLVVAYHLSGPYVRDRLLNDDAVAPRIAVLDEADDPMVLDDLADRLPAGTDTVWCVVPYEAGPDVSGRACDLDATWGETLSVRLTRAAIVRLDRLG